jgi:hypothetical protein
VTEPLERERGLAVPHQDGQLGPVPMCQVGVEERPPRNLPANQARGPVPIGAAAHRSRLDVGVVIIEEADVARTKLAVDRSVPLSHADT